MKRKINLFRIDKALLFAPLLIFGIGLLSILSTSMRSDQSFDEKFVLRQVLWMTIGILFLLLVIRIPYFRLADLAWPFYFVSVFLLVLVLFMPARLGAHRWIGLSQLNLQPSELAKLSVIFVLARFFDNNRIEYLSKDQRLMPFLIVAFPFVLILKEPDLGTALTLLPVLFAMLYLWGFRPKSLAALVLAGAVLSPFLFHFLKDYQKARLLVFVNPNADPLGAGYTIIQSKIAIGSGGLFGKGLFGGTQNQLNFVPENHTDFIFAVIAEEGGFIASAAVLALLFWIVRRGFAICQGTPDRFGSQLACGLTTLFAAQSIVNLGMTMGLLPVVGVPLPLVSYGGSQIVVTMLILGLLINIKIHKPLF